MELHTCLWNDVQAFSFSDEDLTPIVTRFPALKVVRHTTHQQFLDQAHRADLVLTWDFESAWYAGCPKLKAVLTPAAGNDWAQADPDNRVDLIHGSFHGEILAESLLGAMLFMNHKMPDMLLNQARTGWDRNLQTTTRLLANQQVLIIGFGHIAQACARLIESTGAHVTGVRRNLEGAQASASRIEHIDKLPELLPQSDHVVLLLPETKETDRFMDSERLRMMKQGSYLYNFGRGNSLLPSDLLAHMDHLGGAFLDVTEVEPLPPDSPLWHHPKITITPHSSCIYREYKELFITEVIARIAHYID